MAHSHASAPSQLLRSRLPHWVAVLYCAAAILGLPGVILLFSSAYQKLLIQDLVLGGVADQSAVNTWHLIHSGITVVHFICCAAVACGLLLALKSTLFRGMHVLLTAAQWLLYGVNTGGILALCVLIFRVVRYTITVMRINEGVYLLFSMVVSEGLMVLQAWFAFTMLRKYLNSAMDTTASIGYTLSSGKPDSHSISSFTATGLIILAVICLGLAVNQLFTLTIIDSFPSDYYKILTASHPGQYLAAGSFLCCAAGNLLLALYLRRYKRCDEKHRYALRKEAMSSIRK